MNLDQDQQASLAEDEMPQQKRAFLITYSQADMSIFKDCESFAKANVKAFGSCHVVEWACCKEFHKDKGNIFTVYQIQFKSLVGSGEEKVFARLCCFFKLSNYVVRVCGSLPVYYKRERHFDNVAQSGTHPFRMH